MSAVRLRWFLTMTTILAATAALTVLVSNGLDRGGGGSDDQVIAVPGTTAGSTSSTSIASTTIPADAATQVSGTITALHLDGAVPDPREVATPLTITAERGFGNGASITGVTVDGSPATIEWDAGTPFVLSSGGALVLDPVRLDLAPEGLRLNIADGVHTLAPGTYHLDTPVAVGSSGVAGARERVVFAAQGASTLEPRGNATLFLTAAAPRRLLGQGVAHLEGTLEIKGPSGTFAVTRLDAAKAPYDLVFTPAPGGGWTVAGLLAGDVTAS